MNPKLALTRILVAGLIATTPVTAASAHEFFHHHGHGGGPVGGLVRAAVDIATLPVRVVGGVASAVTYYPVPQPYYAQPVYYPYPPQAYAYPPQQPVYAYPQPGYGQ
jgi:hypothetical protein